ncbi:poly(A)-specific ribonuclease PARN-like isoform X2 [Haemaphysalis longicornis]
MEITSENFQQQYGVLEAAINDASFLAMDCEFTGLQSEKVLHAFDIPEERYEKLRETAQGFLVVQVGLCAFKFVKEKHGYEYKAFNVYTFPKQTIRGAPDRVFQCQASSLHFLTRNGFDFNKLFSQGTTYLKPSEFEQLRGALDEKHASEISELGSGNHNASKIARVDVPNDAKAFIKGVLESVQKFVDSNVDGDKAGEDGDGPKEPPNEADGPANDVLHLPECDAFRRKLIYQEVQAKYGKEVQLDTEVDSKTGSRHIAVRRAGSAEHRRAALDAKHQAEKETLEEARGFTRVLELIAQSGKLVVGHNMLLDVIHLLSQFIDTLPKDYNEFKSMVRAAFPALVDTKVLASDNVIKDSFSTTTLVALLGQLGSEKSCLPPVEYEPGYGYESGKGQLHEAGYDAYVTGMCFMGLCHKLGKNKDHSAELSANSAVLKPFLNRIFMMSPDIQSLNMAGNEVIPSRGHVLHVTFPPQWRKHDLVQLFQNYGQTDVRWINDTEAFVALPSTPLAAQALKKLGGKSSQGVCRVVSYSSYMAKSRTVASRVAMLEDVAAQVRKRKRSASFTSSAPSKNPPPKENSDTEPKPKEPKKDAGLVVSPKIFEENDDWS